MGNFCSIDNNPPNVDPAVMARYAKLAAHAHNNPGSLCVVVHDIAKLFVNDHAASHEGGAPVDAFEIQNVKFKRLWQRAESGTATQEDWQTLSNEFCEQDKLTKGRMVYQRIGQHGKPLMLTALNCASKALEFGESSDALESLQHALRPGEQTVVRADGLIKTYYKTDEDFLGMYPPVRDPRAWVHLDPK